MKNYNKKITELEDITFDTEQDSRALKEQYEKLYENFFFTTDTHIYK